MKQQQLIKAITLIKANHVGNYSELLNYAARFVSNKTGWDLALSTIFVNSYFMYINQNQARG